METFLDYEDYTVAWIAPLSVDAGAAICMLDTVHDGNFETSKHDNWYYIGGQINGHNVVIATFPEGKKSDRSEVGALISQVRRDFTRLSFDLLVTVGSGLPDLTRDPALDIRLGDVLISVPYTGAFDDDFDILTPDIFQNLRPQTPAGATIKAAVDRIQILAEDNGFYAFVDNVQRTNDVLDKNGDLGYRYPGQDRDILYEGPFGDATLVQRTPRKEEALTKVWYGNIGFGEKPSTPLNPDPKSPGFKNEDPAPREKDKTIGLELGGRDILAGVEIGSIRGVCDYGDAYKTKEWHGYAAATAAAYAREVLYTIQAPTEDAGNRAEARGSMGGIIPKPLFSTPKAYSTIPLPQNKSIVQRDDIMDQLYRLLPWDKDAHRAALWGLGGSGKTQIALEYAYRRKEKMACSVFWVQANSPAAFQTGYEEIAKAAGLPSSLEGVELLRTVHDWLRDLKNWLLILDNADDLHLFKAAAEEERRESLSQGLLQYIPQLSSGAVLWVTRDGGVLGSLVGKSEGIMVGQMTPEQSLLLLRGANPDEAENHPVIVEERILGLDGLENFPLAITQAREFMRKSRKTVYEYLDIFLEDESEVLSKNFPDTYRKGETNSIMSLWETSLQKVIKELPDAKGLLHALAFFDNRGIPFELIKEAALTGEANSAKKTLKESLRQTVERLVQLSFLQLEQQAPDRKHTTYRQHRLVQLAIRNSLEPSEALKVAHQAQTIITRLFPEPKLETWKTCKLYLPHAVRVTSFDEPKKSDMEFTRLLMRMSNYYYQQGHFQEALVYASKNHLRRKVAQGEEHLDTLTAMAEVATILQELGDFKRAENYQETVLETRGRRGVLGPKHPLTIKALSALASTWEYQEKFTKAEATQKEVLALYTELHGERHPDTLLAMSALALTWMRKGEFSKAEELQLKALELRKEVLGDKHPDTIVAMNNLALIWYQQGKPDTPQGEPKNQGKLNKAEDLQRQVLTLRKTLIGEKHIETIRAKSNLALTVGDQRRRDSLGDSEKLYGEARDTSSLILGEEHPDTIRAKHNLALTWFYQGLYSKAKELQMEVLEICERTVGSDRVLTRLARRNLARTYKMLGLKDEVRKLEREVQGVSIAVGIRREDLDAGSPSS